LDRVWRPEVIAWWCAVWSSDIAVFWHQQVDVHAVEQLALLLDRWYDEQNEGGDVSGRLSAEIRQRQAALGLEPQARIRMGWELPSEAGTRTATPVGTYRGNDGILKPLPASVVRGDVHGPDDPRRQLGRQQDSNVVHLPIREESA
jgi:hypothetical protein